MSQMVLPDGTYPDPAAPERVVGDLAVGQRYTPAASMSIYSAARISSQESLQVSVYDRAQGKYRWGSTRLYSTFLRLRASRPLARSAY